MIQYLKVVNKFLFLVVGLSLSHSVYAHTVQGGGLINGLMHPVFGPDHLLAMVAVGILSVQIGGRAIYFIPAIFLLFMLIGGGLGIANVPFPAVETGIAASVFILGTAIALGKQIPMLLAAAFVGIFGMFHGYAHGMEMPEVAQPVLYATGFISSTAALHIAGVLIGFISRRIPRGDIVLRVLGAWIALVGLYFLF